MACNPAKKMYISTHRQILLILWAWTAACHTPFQTHALLWAYDALGPYIHEREKERQSKTENDALCECLAFSHHTSPDWTKRAGLETPTQPSRSPRHIATIQIFSAWAVSLVIPNTSIQLSRLEGIPKANAFQCLLAAWNKDQSSTKLSKSSQAKKRFHAELNVWCNWSQQIAAQTDRAGQVVK